jgi:hypothetical protein
MTGNVNVGNFFADDLNTSRVYVVDSRLAFFLAESKWLTRTGEAYEADGLKGGIYLQKLPIVPWVQPEEIAVPVATEYRSIARELTR